MTLNIQLWPEQVIELNRELASGYHPDLAALLANIGSGEDQFIERFACIASYVDVALDGMYTSDQMVAMLDPFILPRLKEKRQYARDRTMIIISS